MYGYQDYPAPSPPVCAFKVRSGAQLKDFIQRGEVTELQIYYNRPAALDALKYTVIGHDIGGIDIPAKMARLYA